MLTLQRIAARRRRAAAAVMLVRGVRPVVLMASLANVVVLADATIVVVALPSLGRELGFSARGLPWVVNGYSLAFGGCLLLGGYVADRLGPAAAVRAGDGAVLARVDRLRGRRNATGASARPAGAGRRWGVVQPGRAGRGERAGPGRADPGAGGVERGRRHRGRGRPCPRRRADQRARLAVGVLAAGAGVPGRGGRRRALARPSAAAVRVGGRLSRSADRRRRHGAGAGLRGPGRRQLREHAVGAGRAAPDAGPRRGSCWCP